MHTTITYKTFMDNALFTSEIMKSLTLKPIEDAYEKKEKIPKKALNAKLTSLGLSYETYISLINNQYELNVETDMYREELNTIFSYNPKDIGALSFDLPHKQFVTFYIPFMLFTQEKLNIFQQEMLEKYEKYNEKIEYEQYFQYIFNEIHSNLEKLSTKTLVTELNLARENECLEGESAEKRYIFFVEKFMGDSKNYREFFDVYPVLGRLMIESVIRSLNHHMNIVKRFFDDYLMISHTFKWSNPVLLGIEGDLGDSHKDGQSVKILKTSEGNLVYKPRSLSIDKHYRKLVNWYNQKGLKHSLKSPRVYSKDTYGWQEFVHQKNCEDESEVSRFFYRQGAHLGILYTLRSVDFHYENIIASGEDPVLIDIETLFDNYSDVGELDDEYNYTSLEIKDSVLGTLMLPIVKPTSMIDFDISGISGKGGQISNKSKRMVWDNYGQDDMKISEESIVTEQQNNLPIINGKQVDAECYTSEIIEGFKASYRITQTFKEELIKDDGILDMFQNDSVRHVFRATHVYSEFLNTSISPIYLQNGLLREQLFDFMWNLSVKNEKSKQFIPSEMSDLLKNDVPYFTYQAGGTSLFDSNDKEISHFYNESSLSLSKKRIQRFSERDMERQIRYIKISLATLLDGIRNQESLGLHFNNSNSYKQTDIENKIFKLTDSLLEKAFFSKGEGSTPYWIGTNLDDNNAAFLSPLSINLYDGISGVALYFAQLGEKTNDKRYQDITLLLVNALKTEEDYWLKNNKSVSAFSGIGSLIYVYSYIGALWEDESLINHAIKLLPSIEKLLNEDIVQDNDFIGGYAGVLKVITNLKAFSDNRKIDKLIDLLAARLVNETIPLINGRKDVSNVSLTGFSHGLTGIAFSLAAASHQLSNNQWIQHAQQLLDVEDRYYNLDKKNWFDLRNDHEHKMSPNYWCHGAPGILLGRSYIHKWFPNITMQQLKIEDALGTTLNSNFENTNHSLCHGFLGNANILIDVSRNMNKLFKKEIFEIPGTKNNTWVTGLHPKLESLGLMVGECGIAFGLLKLLYPDIASPLTLEIPLKRTQNVK